MSIYYFGRSEKLEKFGALELPKFKTENNKDWVINGTLPGWVNKQPQYYNFLYQTSAKHHSICDAKARYTYGQGFNVVQAGLSTQEQIEVKAFIKKLEKSKVIQRIILDKVIHGGFAVEVIWDKAGKRIMPYHLDFSFIRVSKPQYDKNGKELPTEYYYTSDWNQKPKENKDWAVFHSFNADEKPDSNKRYIIYYKEYAPDLGVYPFPEYMGGLPYVQADAEVGNFVYNNVKQGFTSGYLFNFFNDDLSDEQRASIELMLKKSKHGSENAGDPFVAFNKPGENGVTVTPISANGQDERYINLNNQIRDEIFTAHTISPLVVGMKGENGFSNNADEIRTAVENFTAGYVVSNQETFNEFVNQIIDFNEIKGDVYLQRLEPIKPQISENVLLQIADKNTIAKYYGLELPKEVVTETVITQREFKVQKSFAECGTDDCKYEFLDSQEVQPSDIYDAISKATFFKQDFTSQLEKSILGALEEDPKHTVKSLAELIGKSSKDIQSAVKSLQEQGLLKGLEITPEGQSEVNDIFVVYKYVKRADVQGPDVLPTTREFCEDMVTMSKTKSWTIEDIQDISVREGRDVFALRGGWYHNPKTEKTTPYCRHTWQQRLVRLK